MLAVSSRGEHQVQNAALAVQLAAAWEARAAAARGNTGARRRLEMLARGVLPREYVAGINGTFWPGRSQVVEDRETGPGGASNLTFFLDGAHTPESMQVAAQWFSKAGSGTLDTNAISLSLPLPRGAWPEGHWRFGALEQDCSGGSI